MQTARLSRCLMATLVGIALLLLSLPLLTRAAPGPACEGINCGVGYCIQEHGGGYRCACLGGYEGQNCDEPVFSRISRQTGTSPCDSSPCQNGGTCTETMDMGGEAPMEMGESAPDYGEDYYVCRCAAGYTGAQCSARTECLAGVSGGLEWEETVPGGILTKSCQSSDSSLRGADIVRRCSPDGEWGELDYTGCTVESGSPPFLLLWVAAEASSRELIESIDPEKFGSNISITVLSNLSEEIPLTQTLDVISSESLSRVLLTYKIEFSKNASIEGVMQSLNISIPPSFNSVGLQSQGYKGFFPSEVCMCSEIEGALRTLCTVVNGNKLTSACSCSSTSDCRCVGPFYVGSGEECAVNTDGDEYPNTVLLLCTESDTQPYCSEDLCPITYYQENTLFPCSEPDDGFVGCRGGEDIWGFIWPNAVSGGQAVVLCPNGQGKASRSCSGTVWDPAEVLDCDSSGFINAVMEAEAVFSNEEEDLDTRLQMTAAIMQELLTLIEPRGGLSHLPGDLKSTNAITSGVVEFLEKSLTPEQHVANIPNQNLFGVFNLALDPDNTEGWMTLQDFEGGAAELLDTMERYSLYLSLSEDDVKSRRVKQKDNAVIGWIRYSSSTDSPVTFPEFQNETIYSSTSSAQITIPPELLRERQAEGAATSPVATTIARGMERVLMPRTDELAKGYTNPKQLMVASPVISAQVAERRSNSSVPITVKFTFDSIEDALDFRCAYWKFSDPVGSGRWAYDGVKMVSRSTNSDGTVIVTCQSTHLTSFAVLVDVSGSVSETSQAERDALMAVSYIGCALSLACLSLTILYFIFIWRVLLSQVHYFIHLNLAIALFLAFLVFVLGIQLARENEGACAFVAALLQYLFLSAFCWMMCEGVMLYLMLVVVFSKISKKWWFFLLLGWAPPLLPVIIGVAVRYMDYGVENDSGELEYCWLSTDKGVIWAFVAPMLVIIIINVVFLVIALVKVFQSKKRQTQHVESTATVNFTLFKALFRATVVLLPVLGLTWVFGLFAVNRNSTWLAWLFTIFNTLQGVFIFIFHVLMSDKFWKNSHIKRLRSRASSTFRSSRFGYTSSSTLKRSSLQEKGGTVAKYYPASEKKASLLQLPSSVSESPTEMTKIDGEGDHKETQNANDDAGQKETEDATTVIANTESGAGVDLSTAATKAKEEESAKELESTAEQTTATCTVDVEG